MSGPIIRTGATPKFWENWDKVFGDNKTPQKPAKKTKAAASKKKKAAKKKKKSAR